MTATIDTASRLAGAVWGYLVGDAVGVRYGFRVAGETGLVRVGEPGSRGQPIETWSDSGALMLALLDSLLEAGFDPADQGRRALAWHRDGAYTPAGDGAFDIGLTASAALRAPAEGTSAVDAGPSHQQASSSGSLVRILPLALVERDSPPRVLIDRAHLASRVTHGHPCCQVACAAYCLAARELLQGARPDAALRSGLVGLRATYSGDTALAGHLAALDELEVWMARGGGFVIDAFWSAWDAFAGATDYADAIRRAVRCGRETDTTAAIAGGLAGAYWGWAAIPLVWRRQMRGRAAVTPLVDRLVASTGARTSTASPLRVDLLALAGVPGLETAAGRVGITFLPGKKREGLTGPFWRDLDADLTRLRELGVDALFLLVEDVELEGCLVPELPEVMASEGPELIRYPIRDPRIPLDPPGFRVAVRDLLDRVGRGQTVAIACRVGIDRSGMVAACLLREAGLGADEAIAKVQAAREGSITLREQQAFVRAWPSISSTGRCASGRSTSTGTSRRSVAVERSKSTEMPPAESERDAHRP